MADMVKDWYNFTNIYANKHYMHKYMYTVFVRVCVYKELINDNQIDYIHTSNPLYQPSLQVLLMTSQSIAQRENGSSSCSGDTGKVISISINVYFIHGDIHRRSCQEYMVTNVAMHIQWLYNDDAKVSLKISNIAMETTKIICQFYWQF